MHDPAALVVTDRLGAEAASTQRGEARGFGLDDVTDDEVQVHAVLSHLGFRHLLEHELRAAPPAAGMTDRYVTPLLPCATYPSAAV